MISKMIYFATVCYLMMRQTRCFSALELGVSAIAKRFRHLQEVCHRNSMELIAELKPNAQYHCGGIWTRLVFDLGDRWLEVFNALDENGYDLHIVEPVGEFRKCI